MNDSKYFGQVELLIKVLPFIDVEQIFALKGGTAINLFVRDMPRLSVDIDLTYLPLDERSVALNEIGQALRRIKSRIESSIVGARVVAETVKGTTTPSSLRIAVPGAQIKIEVNLVLRGSVYPPLRRDLCTSAQEKFNSFVAIQNVSLADLYGGKLCAALDRQHPRDFFDVKMLLENDGITTEVKNAFVVYLASHPRPMNELLNPIWKDISKSFESEFEGMTTQPVSLGELLSARDVMLQTLRNSLTDEDKQFLISVKNGAPVWSLLNLKGIEKLPGLQWKVQNVLKMDSKKREGELVRLKKVLS